MYKLIIGKPGSSYTFSIAERIGLDPLLVGRAKKLVDDDHFRLDKLLNRTEQDLQTLDKERKELQQLVNENKRLKKEMEDLINKERHQQQVELLKQQNKISEERIAYLKEMERKLKQIIFDWRKAENQEDKKELIRQMQALLFRQNQKQANEKVKKKFNSKYQQLEVDITVGQTVLMKNNHQVGEVTEIKGKKAIVKVGLMPITIDLENLVPVAPKHDGQ